MIIRSLQLTKETKNVILSAEVIFAKKSPEWMYLSVDKKYASFVSANLDPFLAAVLLPCMKTGEDIVIEGPVSPKLLRNTKKIMKLVASWNVGLTKVKVTCHPELDSGSIQRRDKMLKRVQHDKLFVASFFSAGADSFYTYLKHKKSITHLILVHGFDIPLSNTDFFQEVKQTVAAVAKEAHVQPIFVTTNIAEIVEKRLVWDFAHGGALAAVALFLQGKMEKVFIPGAVRHDELFPYGTHPQLDPLWSTERVILTHDGTEHNRLGKILSRVSKSPLALKYLRVCTQNIKGTYNCSRCYKCLQTMIELICAKTFAKAATFEHPINLEAVRKMYYDYALQYNTQGEVNLELLTKQHREPTLREAIAESLQRSKHPGIKRTLTKKIASFDQRYNDRRFYRFVFTMNHKQDRNWLFKFLLKKGVLK